VVTKVVKKVNIIIKVIVIVIVIVIGSILILLLSRSLNDKKDQKTIECNCGILKKMEKADVIEVAEQIKKKQGQVEDEKVNESSKVITKVNTKSNKEYFENDVFMGDSITEELEFYNILNKSSILAKKGDTVIKGKDLVISLGNIKPKRIFVLYGLNDLDFFQNVSEFKKNYADLIKAIKEKVPNSEIYIQSSMPVQEKMQQKNKNYSQDRMEKILQIEEEVAKEERVNYIDIRPIIKGKDELYEPDGMHFKAKFCGLWLDFLKNSLEK